MLSRATVHLEDEQISGRAGVSTPAVATSRAQALPLPLPRPAEALRRAPRKGGGGLRGEIVELVIEEALVAVAFAAATGAAPPVAVTIAFAAATELIETPSVVAFAATAR